MWNKRYVSNTDAITAFLRGEIVYNKYLANYQYFKLRNWTYKEGVIYLNGNGQYRFISDKSTLVATFAKFEQFQKGWAIATPIPTPEQENRLLTLRDYIATFKDICKEDCVTKCPGSDELADILSSILSSFEKERDGIVNLINMQVEDDGTN